jgi:hypothetical protein
MGKLNWEKKKYKPDYIQQKNRTQTRTKEVILNEAIHKLIVIKKRRTEDGRPQKEIIRVQKEIDKLIKLRDQFRLANKFAEYRLIRNIK